MLDFVIAGAQKCATSWLYYVLKNVEYINLPHQKNEGLYIGRYPKSEVLHQIPTHEDSLASVVGDVSVEYIFDKRSPRRLSEMNQDCKVVICVRHPISRAQSAFLWNVRRGNLSPIDINSVLHQAAETTNKSDYMKRADGDIDLLSGLLNRGLYGDQINEYLDYFSEDNLFVVPFQGIVQDPVYTARSVVEFVIPENDNRDRPLNVNFRPKVNSRIKPIILVENIMPKNFIIDKFFSLINRAAVKVFGKGSYGSLNDQTFSKLVGFFQPTVYKMRQIIGSLPSFKLWRRLQTRPDVCNVDSF